MAAEKEQLVTVKGISKADYQSWRHNPVSQVMLRFLADKRAYLERSAIDQWISGGLSLQADQTIRGQIIELFEIENMPFDALVDFYQEEDNAATSHSGLSS